MSVDTYNQTTDPTTFQTLRDPNGTFGDALPAVFDTLTSGSHPGSNMPGRRREDDTNLVYGFNHTGGGSKDVAIVDDGTPPLDSSNAGVGVFGVAFRGREGGISAELSKDIAPAMRSGKGSASRGSHALTTAGVRRLTPVECERLQGLPDGWTDLGPDSRRYAALGDAVTANVAEWIGRRLLAHIEVVA